MGDRIAKTLEEKGGEFYHGYTYSGHPVACAVALKNLEIIEKEGMIETVRNDTGAYLTEALTTAVAGHQLVGQVRGEQHDVGTDHPADELVLVGDVVGELDLTESGEPGVQGLGGEELGEVAVGAGTDDPWSHGHRP